MKSINSLALDSLRIALLRNKVTIFLKKPQSIKRLVTVFVKKLTSFYKQVSVNLPSIYLNILKQSKSLPILL